VGGLKAGLCFFASGIFSLLQILREGCDDRSDDLAAGSYKESLSPPILALANTDTVRCMQD
jgi:hypothetical protein